MEIYLLFLFFNTELSLDFSIFFKVVQKVAWKNWKALAHLLVIISYKNW